RHSSPWQPQRYGCHTLSTGPKEAASIVSAFPNYFGDVSLFLGRLKAICGKAGSAEYVLPKQETAPSRPQEVPDLSWFKQRHRRWNEGGKGKNK
ncbi:hypothetical protein ACFOHH_06655, partial [Shinella pollutisoli]